jgi:hypothetical protein
MVEGCPRHDAVCGGKEAGRMAGDDVQATEQRGRTSCMLDAQKELLPFDWGEAATDRRTGYAKNVGHDSYR